MTRSIYIALCWFIGVFSGAIVGHAAEPTWSNSIARIVYEKCTPCHRQGEIAPFALSSYAQVVAHSSTIAIAVKSGYMPPWKPERGHAQYLGDRSLLPQEQAEILSWLENGMAEGIPEEAPPSPTFPSGSQLGVPDVVLTMSEPWTVQAGSNDVYRYFVLPSNFAEDKSISAIEFRPGNPKVVHHVLYFFDTTGTARQRDAADPLPGYEGFGDPGFTSAGSYLGWVPGSQQRLFPTSIGTRIPKGADVVIQVHYAPSVTQEIDQSSLNIFFNQAPSVRVIQQFEMSPNDLDDNFIIPKNAVKTFIGSYRVPIDISVIAVAPHMHLLGTRAKAYALTPEGDTIPFVVLPEWDFNWQGSYAFTNLVRIPRRSVLYYEAEYDNTTTNPLNPSNPPALVTWGERTTDEMFLCYVFWLPYRNGDEQIVMDTRQTSVEHQTNNGFDVIITPNPSTGNSVVQFVVPTELTAHIDIVNTIGSVVATMPQLAAAQQGLYSMAIPALPSGFYVLRIRGNHSGNLYHTNKTFVVQ
jgi:hypothetical protein